MLDMSKADMTNLVTGTVKAPVKKTEEKESTKVLGFRATESLIKEMKVYVALHDMNMQTLCSEAVKEYMENHK